MVLLKEKMEIIKYELKYKQQVQNVCISQSTSRYKDDNAKKATLALYCDPYIDKEICLILKNDLDEACGYILCAKDLKAYEKNAYLIKRLQILDFQSSFFYLNIQLNIFYYKYVLKDLSVPSLEVGLLVLKVYLVVNDNVSLK